MEIILIIHPPTVRYTENFETVEYLKCVANLEELIRKTKDCRVIAENVLQLAGANALDIFSDVVRILPVGTTYSHSASAEQHQWQTQEKTKK